MLRNYTVNLAIVAPNIEVLLGISKPVMYKTITVRASSQEEANKLAEKEANKCEPGQK